MGSKNKASPKAKRTGAASGGANKKKSAPGKIVTARKKKGAASPKKMKASSDEDPTLALHNETAKAVTKNYDPKVHDVPIAEEEHFEEIEAISDGSEEGDAEPPEIDDEGDDESEGYF